VESVRHTYVCLPFYHILFLFYAWFKFCVPPPQIPPISPSTCPGTVFLSSVRNVFRHYDSGPFHPSKICVWCRLSSARVSFHRCSSLLFFFILAHLSPVPPDALCPHSCMFLRSSLLVLNQSYSPPPPLPKCVVAQPFCLRVLLQIRGLVHFTLRSLAPFCFRQNLQPFFPFSLLPQLKGPSSTPFPFCLFFFSLRNFFIGHLATRLFASSPFVRTFP